MKKFKFLVKYGLKKRVFSKAFVTSNAIIAIIIIALVNLPSIINLFAPDKTEVEITNVVIINETEKTELTADLTIALSTPSLLYSFEVSEVEISEFDLDEFWDDSDVQIALHFSGNIENPEVIIYNKISQNVNPTLMFLIEKQIVYYQVGDFQMPVFSTPPSPDQEPVIDEGSAAILTNIVLLPMFFLIVTAVQFLGTDIIEEKSSKAIDTIIASVPVKTHFLSKITYSILFVLFQGFMASVFGLIGFLISMVVSRQSTGIGIDDFIGQFFFSIAEMLPNWPIIVLLMILFVIAGVLFYLVLAALFSSMATTQEDYQQLQAPVMLILIFGFYTGIFAPIAGADGFMKVMAFIPFFAPMVAPIALISGIMSTTEAVIALIVLVLFLIGFLYLVSPIYKVAILSYDQTKIFKRLIGYFKKAFPKNGKKEVDHNN